MLGRLSVQQKLSLLLTLPLAALVLTGVPFAVSRLDSAISAAVTVEAARDAREVAELIEGLQQERLLALASLASGAVDRSPYAALNATSADRAQGVVESGSAPVRRAAGELGSLDAIRRQVVSGTVAPADVQNAYHARIVGLIDALELTRQPRLDIAGLRQMSALDAMLRTNEEANRIGAALLVAATDKQSAAQLAIEARALRRIDVDRFRQQAEAPAVAMIDEVERGSNARRLDELSSVVSAGDGLRAPLTEIVAAVRSAATQAGALQERVVHATVVRAQARAAGAELAAVTLIGLAIALLVCVIWLSFRVSRSVAVPLRHLTSAARRVADLAGDELVRVADGDADHSHPPTLAMVQVRGTDEIGELAAAFNRVQTTAALLMEQQVAGRRNVSVMFANIARRTRGLVARQLAFIDEFERNEQDERMLVKLYRLDHLTTRLRRSADSLLVVSGIREDEPICAAAPLLEVVRSAVAEIEGYQAVRIATISEVTILPQLVPDLRLLLAELLENATAFSPPGMPVEVYARLSGTCEITVVDHGIGLSEERLAEENRRLVERERLDIAPTSVLGLFVVGRIARRHGLRVQLRHSPGQGVSVEVRVPPTLFTTDRVLSRQVSPPPPQSSLPARPRTVAPQHPRVYDPRFDDTCELTQLAHWAASEQDSSFTWFEPPELEAAASAVPGAIVDGTAVNGTAVNGTAVNGTAVNGTAVNGTAVNGTAVNGTVLDSPVADDARVALPAAPISAVPEVVAPEETAPEETAPEKTAPEKTAPDNPVPGESASPVEPTPPVETAPSAAPALTRSGLTRRQPGGHLPTFGADQPCVERSRTDQSATPEPMPSIRGELTRRVPGTHLDRSLRTDHMSALLTTCAAQTRDPAAERAELDSFVAGVARATGAPGDTHANQ